MAIKNPLAKMLVWIILIIWSVAVLYPIVWTLLDALKNNEQFFLNAPWALPKFPLLWSNFSYVWSKYNFSTYFLNSIVVTVGSTLLGMILAAMTAYILARYDFKGNKVLLTIYISSMMIPFALALIPLFFLLNDLHLINTWLGLILVYAALNLPFGIFLLVGFYKSLPKEIEEAAIIDGTSHYGTFFRVMLPLSQPGLITVMITNMLNNWNEYFLGVVLTNEPTKYTLPIGLAVMQAEMQYRVEWGPLFAGLLITTLPTLIVYMIYQRQIASGITAGAVK
ncbi:carbohydrate ABC transporter permease [Paenibacillus qinlingensis]|uniref:N-acetylglucosamine transport system permease protein n=1 Tax=Paenibacillus qinlingensis TaxID=1837343 RepID=A0ABU1NNA4_9BACL|nr:carbohydrate ABC transporter permease [Paenibacillus qinlingensis]MDR6548939.1 N-acetylglucosamine transport system permease protein [Paenibacillus qinlingensis]